MNNEQREVLELVERAKGSGAEARAAAARLAAIGMPAVPAVLEAIRQSRLPSKALLDVVPQVRAPELLPLMLEALKERGPYLPMLAIKVLGRSKEERAFRPLLDIVADRSRGDAFRGAAAEALGELGERRAVPELLKTVEAIAAGKRIKEHAPLVRFLVIALARLGNQDAAEVVIKMSGHRQRSVREEAVIALKHVVGRGLFPALQKGRRRRSAPARAESLQAIFYLGLRESVEELISAFEDNRGAPDLAVNIIYMLNDLTGGRFAEDAEAAQLRQWWAQHQTEFRPGVCYRLGKPISVSDFAVRLETDEFARRHWLLEELYIITGADFRFSPSLTVEEQDEMVARAREWARGHGAGYEPGAVYKYGHRQDLDEIFAP